MSRAWEPGRYYLPGAVVRPISPTDAVGLVFRSTQATGGVSAATEPTWPTTEGASVVDGEVTWQAVTASTVTWKAVPLMVSEGSEPSWPAAVGEFVEDGGVRWECIGRQVQDTRCPQGKVVAIAAGKVFAADGDIVRFCATNNPLDWSSPNDAGFLPTGLQQENANDTAVLNLYRGNLVAFNAGTFQMWQVDPDPAAMALIDQMAGIGSTYPRAAQPVGDELFFLSQLGVRTVGVSVGSANLATGDVGAPVDVLVREALAQPGADGVATYYPGGGQYWLAVKDQGGELPLAMACPILPDAEVGTYYTYTPAVTGGGQLQFAITSGELPPGMSLSASTGTISGTPTDSGSYAFTLTVSSGSWTPQSCGHTINVEAELVGRWWLLNYSTGQRDTLHYSDDLETWQMTTRDPFADRTADTAPGAARGAFNVDESRVIITSNNMRIERHSAFDFSAPLSPQVIQIVDDGLTRAPWIYKVGGILFALRYSGEPPYYSEDNGLTWTQLSGFVGFRIAKIGSRWIRTSGSGVFHSEQSIPTTWTSATLPSENAPAGGLDQETLIGNGSAAVVFGNWENYSRTTDGETWTNYADAPGMSRVGIGNNAIAVAQLVVGNVWMMAVELNVDGVTRIIRTTDAGLTWHHVTVSGVSSVVLRFTHGNGRIVASATLGLHVSDDMGATWSPLTLPGLGVIPWDYPSVEFVRYRQP
jgi:hypothetical protein